MTKLDLYVALVDGKVMMDFFEFCPGQECAMFKADEFSVGNHIIYIPDISLNDICIDAPIPREDVLDVVDHCYTGDDFVDECGGDVQMAERLFWYVDWQNPCSAVDEIDDDDIEVAPVTLLNTTVYTTYASETDMTFIMKDTTEEDILVSTECVGWYFGRPNEEATKKFAGKLKADFVAGETAKDERSLYRVYFNGDDALTIAANWEDEAVDAARELAIGYCGKFVLDEVECIG